VSVFFLRTLRRLVSPRLVHRNGRNYAGTAPLFRFISAVASAALASLCGHSSGPRRDFCGGGGRTADGQEVRPRSVLLSCY